MTDVNEVAGFINACSSPDYLHNLYLHIAERLRVLGRHVVSSPVPIPGTPLAPSFTARQPSHLATPPAAPAQQQSPAASPAPAAPVTDHLGDLAEAMKAMAAEFRGEPELAASLAPPKVKRPVVRIAGGDYPAEEIRVAGVLVGWRLGNYEVSADGQSCNCPDYAARHRGRGTTCKHGAAAARLTAARLGQQQKTETAPAPETAVAVDGGPDTEGAAQAGQPATSG